MQDEIVIRKAVMADWEETMAMTWRTFLKFEAKDYGMEGVDSFRNFISDPLLRRMFLLGTYHMFVATYHEKIIGMVSLRNENHISLLFVDEASVVELFVEELSVSVVSVVLLFPQATKDRAITTTSKSAKSVLSLFFIFFPSRNEYNKKCVPLRDARKTPLSMLRHVFHYITRGESTFLPIVLPC